MRLVVTTDLDVGALPLGASIAVDGVCLTVVERAAGRFAADLGPETLALTTLGALAAGARVHLERPLRLGRSAGRPPGRRPRRRRRARVVARRELGDALELDIAAPRAGGAAFVAARARSPSTASA